VTTTTRTETTTELAQRNMIRAFRAGRYILIVAEGNLPTPGYQVNIEESPLRIFPQQYNLLRHERPGTWPDVVVPYLHSEVFVYPEDQYVVTVHHAEGQDEVNIEEFGADLAQFAALVSPHQGTPDNEATGTSPSLRFDEAFADAIANLPPSEPSHPDALTRIDVLETGALFGGFAGFHHLFVKARSTTD
jgi:hypothetical protein